MAFRMPRRLFQLLPAQAKLGEAARQAEIDREKRVIGLRLRPSGRHALPWLSLAAKARHGLQLLVTIPEQQRMHRCQVAVRRCGKTGRS